MRLRTLLLPMLAASACRGPHSASTMTPAEVRSPIIIAHRGASGELPEHTLAAYDRAIAQGADIIEPDVVSTKDHILVIRHENEIGGTTDVADRYPARKRSAVVDGDTTLGWFVEDFTLAELKTLRARERLAFRSHANDGQFDVPTLDEVLALVRRREQELGRVIGVYPETKHPSYFRSLGLPLEERLLAQLGAHGFRGRNDAVFIQSFETGNLRALHARTTIRLIQLVDAAGAPWDLASAGDPRRYADLITPAGLREVATYAYGIGPAKVLVQPVSSAGLLEEPTPLVRDAHAAGLMVHVWTMRADPQYLPVAYKGDARAEWRRFAALGVDGIFGDFPADGVKALRER